MSPSLKHAGAVIETAAKPRRHLVGRALIALVMLVGSLIAYTVWDGHRFIVSTTTITHGQLPASFDGYRIVQVTDLHSARFGERQETLLAAIRDAEPDLVLLTGDYTDSWESPGGPDLEPIAELVERLPKEVPAYYVLGNWDARSTGYGGAPLQGSHLELAIEGAGVKPLYPYVRIERGGEHIWLSDWTLREFRDERAMLASRDAFGAQDNRVWERVVRMYDLWWQRQKTGHDPAKEFDIAVTHRPLDFPDYDAELARSSKEEQAARAATSTPPAEQVYFRELDYDLTIAGHTHGGQFRLPLLGGLVAPDGTLFPDQRLIQGVRTDAKGRVGYISSGLGAGGQVPLLRFRFLNTPELSVIVLRRPSP